MAQDKFNLMYNEGLKKYTKLSPELRKKFPPNFYIAIEPKSGEYFVGDNSTQVLKDARKKFPRKFFFGAHVGYLAGRI